jgi:hypothetical protein
MVGFSLILNRSSTDPGPFFVWNFKFIHMFLERHANDGDRPELPESSRAIQSRQALSKSSRAITHHYTIASLHQYAITPLRHCPIAPLPHYAITPLRHYPIALLSLFDSVGGTPPWYPKQRWISDWIPITAPKTRNPLNHSKLKYPPPLKSYRNPLRNHFEYFQTILFINFIIFILFILS